MNSSGYICILHWNDGVWATIAEWRGICAASPSFWKEQLWESTGSDNQNHETGTFAWAKWICSGDLFSRDCFLSWSHWHDVRRGCSQSWILFNCFLLFCLLILLSLQEDRENILRARATGKAVLTNPFRLLESNHLGVVLTLPVYRLGLPADATIEERIEATAGWAYALALCHFYLNFALVCQFKSSTFSF